LRWDCHLHVFDGALATMGGHYAPQTASLAQAQALGKTYGIQRFVLVQPSVYGRDNSLMLRALQREPGGHRGVAVVDEFVSESELRAMHEIGVRGIRFNRVSPVGRHPDPAATLRTLSPLLRRLSWHVQWFVEADGLVALPALQQECGLPFVLDHVGSLQSQTPADSPAWAAMERLGRSGHCWLKLSAWYRLGAHAPYDAMDAVLARLLPWFCTGEQVRLVWGSDWPHTGVLAPDLPDYGLLLAPIKRALTASQLENVLRISPQLLYG
jgi:predicted TIM-barrel fold metal-dependent hydrolase